MHIRQDDPLFHLELLPHLGVLLALGDPHHGGEDEDEGGSKHGAPEAHHEAEVRERDADGREEGQEQRRAHLPLRLGRVLLSRPRSGSRSSSLSTAAGHPAASEKYHKNAVSFVFENRVHSTFFRRERQNQRQRDASRSGSGVEVEVKYRCCIPRFCFLHREAKTRPKGRSRQSSMLHAFRKRREKRHSRHGIRTPNNLEKLINV